MRALRWALGIMAIVLLSIGVAGVARQKQFDSVAWTVCGRHRAPCVKGVAENGAPWALSYIAARNELFFMGGMGKSFDVVVASALRRFPKTKRLVVSGSPGGSVNGVVGAAKRLNRHAVAVRIEGDCASACALLWALADVRQALPAGKIGLHAGRADSKVPEWLHGVAASRNRTRFEAALRTAGFPPETIARGLATPHDRIFWIDAPSLRRMGVRFGWIEPRTLSRPGSTPPLAPRS